MKYLFTLFFFIFFIKPNLVNAYNQKVEIPFEYQKVVNIVTSYEGDIVAYELQSNDYCKNNFDNSKCHFIVIEDKINSVFHKILNNENDLIDNSLKSPSISSDGKFLSYTSSATNIDGVNSNLCKSLIDNNLYPCSYIYLYNISDRTSKILKVNNNFLNENSYISSISGDGKNIVFESSSTNIVSLGSNSCKSFFDNSYRSCIHIYKYNIINNYYTLVSKSLNNIPANQDSFSPTISHEGRYVSFSSSSDNMTNDYYQKYCLSPLDNTYQTCLNIFLVDTYNNKIQLISKNSQSLVANNMSYNPHISDNGQYIAYETLSTNLVSKDYNNRNDIILFDILLAKNSLITININQNNKESNLESISNDGNLITYLSKSSNIIEGVNNNINNLFIYNHRSQKTTLLSKSNDFDINVSILTRNGKKVIYYKDKEGIYFSKSDINPPLIKENQMIKMVANTIVNLKDKLEVSDDLTKNEDLNFTYVDDYSVKNVGFYQIKVIFIDEQNNLSESYISLEIIKEDVSPPKFNEIEQIRILKGSKNLFLLDYINVSDDVDKNLNIEIIDDGNLNLNLAGIYQIKLRCVDSSKNESIKDLKVIVYREYNFVYYLQMIVIIFLIGGLFFSTIKVKIR